MGLLGSCDLKDLRKRRESTTGHLEGGVPGTGHSPATQAGRREKFWCVWGTAGKQGTQEHQEMGSEDSRQGKVTRAATGPSWRQHGGHCDHPGCCLERMRGQREKDRPEKLLQPLRWHRTVAFRSVTRFWAYAEEQAKESFLKDCERKKENRFLFGVGEAQGM